MPDAGDTDRLSYFLETLRGESDRGVGHGVRRMAGLLRGGIGLAAGVARAAKRGSEAALSERELAGLEVLVGRLGELKGLPMKLGQIMSYLELDLPEEARRLLGLLQRQSPATPLAAVETVVREDLGARAEALLAGLERTPVSIASIGQVHRARPVDGRIVVDMGQIARDKLALARLRLLGRLMLLFRIRFGLYAVLSRLGAVCDWSALERQAAE